MNKKEQIYETALKLFNQYGFDKTPTSMIAHKAGVATGTLFHYFPTKEDLINSLYLNCKDSMLRHGLNGAEQEKTYRGRIKKVYENMLKWGVEYRDEFLFFQQFSNSPSILDRTRTEGEARFNVINEMIAEGIEQELLKAIDSELMINTIIGMISSNIYFAMQKPELVDDSDFKEITFTLIWDAIKR